MTGASGAESASPAELAERAAESIRALNHLTLTGSRNGYEWPADVDAVIGNVQTLAARLGQALRQADDWITTAHTAGRVGHDGGRDPGMAVYLLSIALDGAVSESQRMAQHLDFARAESSHLTGRTP